MHELESLRKLREAASKLSDQIGLELVEFMVQPGKSEGDNHNVKIIFRIKEEVLEHTVNQETSNDEALDALFMDIVSGMDDDEKSNIKEEVDKWLEE